MPIALPADLNANQPAIVITASRLPEPIEDSAASASTVDQARIERLGEPAVTAFLRLLPSASVATSGPAGSFTQVRIRGAEANHTLLFIDGIRANDPAAGNEPRFELLNADIASRIELVRGPQSALWGSEAIGGVVAVSGSEAQSTGATAQLEGGSFGFRRAAGSARWSGDNASLALAAGHQQADGIDSLAGDGDRDGFTNTAVRGLARLRPAAKLELSAAGFWLAGRSDYDGFDPLTFLRADTTDRTRNRLAAGRIGAIYGSEDDKWQARLTASLLGSTNRNLLDGSEINRTKGGRSEAEAQVDHRFSTGRVAHAVVVAATGERERFTASDVAFGGFTDQSRSREHVALTGEWRASIGDTLIADVVLRRDAFNRFKDATTARGSLLLHVGGRFSIAASYGEGIAQPTFFDLYGFFPGSYVGNPSLKAEYSRGMEGSVRYRHGDLAASLTAFRQNLRDEIVGTFDPSTFLGSAANAQGSSRRQGIEAEIHWQRGKAVRLSAVYAFLHASEPEVDGGHVREARRPRHSGSLVADGEHGRLSYGASIAYVGARTDTDFDLFQSVRLSPYWLSGARIAYRLRDGIELFARMSNAFDARYQDVVGYRTEGRSAYAGLRLAVDR
jgi:vitamin B12 transporter